MLVFVAAHAVDLASRDLFLRTSLLHEFADIPAHLLRIRDALDLVFAVRTIRAVQRDRADAEDLLPQRAHQLHIEDAVQQDLVCLRAEQTDPRDEAILGDRIAREADRQPEVTLAILPQNRVLFELKFLGHRLTLPCTS